MRVEIVSTNNITEEYKYALQLKKECEEYLLSKMRGSKNDIVLIMPNYNLYGVEINHISMFIVAYFDEGLSESLRCRMSDNDGHIKYVKKTVYISSICFAMQIVSDTVESLDSNNNTIIAHSHEIDIRSYLSTLTFSVRNFLEHNTSENYSPYIMGGIAFKNIKGSKCVNPISHLIMRGVPTWKEIIENIVLEKGVEEKVSKRTGLSYCTLGSFIKDRNAVEHIRKLSLFLDSLRKKVGPLTKKKLDTLSKNRKELPQYYDVIGRKLLVLKGGAGSGKTMRLLEIMEWAVKQKKRCLFLSYNRALITDIDRLLKLQNISSDEYGYPNVKCQTIQSYFWKILDEIIHWKSKVINDNSDRLSNYNIIQKNLYLKNYFHYIEQANQLLEDGDEPPQYKYKNSGECTEWYSCKKRFDYVLIDEAQDWYPEERNILFRQFGSDKIIISEGEHQLIRRASKLNWIIDGNYKIQSFGGKSMRQTAKLCKFQRKFADMFGIPWDVKENNDLLRGKIIVYYGDISLTIANSLKNLSKGYSEDKYDDILFLSPSDMYNKEKEDISYWKNGNEVLDKNLRKKEFSLTSQWKQKYDLSLFDVNYHDEINRSQPLPGEYRLISYDICRGLESYIVVALDMDVFFDEKIKYYRTSDEINQDIFSQDEKSKALHFAVNWSLIVFSRPVEYLIITIRNKESVFYDYLKRIKAENPNLLEIIEEDINPVEKNMADYSNLLQENFSKDININKKEKLSNSNKDIDDSCVVPNAIYDDAMTCYDDYYTNNYQDEWDSAYNNPYYNDNLDMDQQSPEFWDSF